MAKENPSKPKAAGEEKAMGAPHREDSGRMAEGPAQFMKDKRKG